MEFRPFWDLLADLGITLPNPSKIKGTEQPKPVEPSGKHRMRGQDRVQPRDMGEMLELLELMMETGGHPARGGDRDWVAPGKNVTVDRYKIPGMVYVGEDLSSLRNYRNEEPALIRPKLKVQCLQPDHEGKQMPYQPSYTQMKPACRAAYLQWLSTGRRDQTTHISYVWLFFYGLERRVLHDLLKVDLSAEPEKLKELDAIITEVEQLQQVYSDASYSFSGPFSFKAGLFVDICRAIRSCVAESLPAITPLPDKSFDLADAKPLSLQIALGQQIKQGQPIAAEWALAWVTRIGRRQLRSPATRCLDEFRALFQLRYAQQYGEGLILKPGKVSLRVDYHPASHSFGGSIPINLNHLPDIAQFSGKLGTLSDLIDACTTEIEPLSRLLSRMPQARHTPAAIALLPVDLLATHGGETVHNLRRWLDQLFAEPHTQTATVSGLELFQYWSGANPERLAKAEATGLSQLLARLGYGIEPDPTLGGTSPTLKSYVALFRLPTCPSKPNPTYLKSLSTAYFEATLLVRLAIAVASGDAPPSPIEQEYLVTHLHHWVTVDSTELVRLHAHLEAACQEKPLLRTLKTRLEKTPLQPAREIAQFLVQVASADGQLIPKEVQQLEKAYALLGLDAQTVYSDIHNVSTRDRPVTPAIAPVTVQRASPARGHKIPAAQKGQKKSPELMLDMALVQSKLEESKAISSLLSEIFVEEEESIPQKRPASSLTQSNRKPKGKKSKTSKSSHPASSAGREIAGLDAAHSELLMMLDRQPIWQRAELEAIATRLNLMLDGALELINETAFDRCEEAVIEGDNPIEVNADVLRELLA